MKFKATIEVELDIMKHFIDHGYGVGDMIEYEIREVFNDSDLEYEVVEIKEVE